jgi:glucose/arabinose dehydrogenase
MVARNEVESVLGGQGTSDALPQTANPSAMAFYRGDLLPSFRGDLLVAGGDEPVLTRIKFDGRNPSHIVMREPLLENVGGIISALAVSREGAIYFCVDDKLMRLVAGRSR